jgi:hypothetical protein
MDGYDDLPPAEAARERRRDRDAEAGARAGMKSGLAKQFKQVLDTQARRGKEAAHRLSESSDRAEPSRRGERSPERGDSGPGSPHPKR